MTTILRFMFGSTNRAINTAVLALVLWGIVSPESVRAVLALCWNNFWFAFGDLAVALLQIAIVGGVVVWCFKKAFGGSNRR